MRKLVYVVVAGLLILAACGGSEPAAVPEPEPAEEATTEAEEEEVATADVSGETEIEFEVGDFYFDPAILQGEAGQELTLMIHHEGDAPHTFTSDDLKIDESLKPGKEVDVSLTFPDSGSAEFHCEIHPDMMGSIEVVG